MKRDSLTKIFRSEDDDEMSDFLYERWNELKERIGEDTKTVAFGIKAKESSSTFKIDNDSFFRIPSDEKDF